MILNSRGFITLLIATSALCSVSAFADFPVIANGTYNLRLSSQFKSSSVRVSPTG
jgi:hypothetical protein